MAGRRPVPQTRAAEHAVLGLLILEQGGDAGIHGYVLMQRFNDSALREIVRIEPGMLYHHLKSLAAAGLIVTTVERQSARPDRQLHAVTPAGRETLLAWVVEPVRATRELRLEFLVKLYLAQHLGDGLASSLVGAQSTVIASHVHSLNEQLASIDDSLPDASFRRQVLALRLAQNHAASSWLDFLT